MDRADVLAAGSGAEQERKASVAMHPISASEPRLPPIYLTVTSTSVSRAHKQKELKNRYLLVMGSTKDQGCDI